MDPAPTLPLALSELPDALQRFCNPDGPTPARMMAAKGLVPVRGNDQVLMLAQLGSDADDAVADAAKATLLDLPDNVLGPAVGAELPSAVLHFLAAHLKGEELLGALTSNPSTADATLVDLARSGSETLTERIAINEVRLLGAPPIIEALYKNRNTRMSTADRIIELAARNKVELPGIPAYKDHAEALQGQLIPEPSDEPLPQDSVFNESLVDGDLEDVIDRDKYTGEEEVKKKFKPLNMAIAEMSKAEKLRLAVVGGLPARQILIRDNIKQVAMATIGSPQVTTAEAADTAKSKEVSEEILRYIGSRKEWIKSAEVKHNLVFNAKTPVGISIKYLSHLRTDELKKLAQSRNVSAQIKSLASQWVQRREKK